MENKGFAKSENAIQIWGATREIFGFVYCWEKPFYGLLAK